MSLPPDPVSQEFGGAIAIHEFYENLRKAGFSEMQALYLTGKLIQATAGRNA